MSRASRPYDEAAAAQYDSYADVWKAYLPIIRQLIARCDYQSVLDLGCGTASLLIELSPAISRGAGVDISPAMVAEAQRKANERGVNNLSFRVSDLSTLRADRCYDLIVSTDGVLPYVVSDAALGDLLHYVGSSLSPRGSGILEFWTPEANVPPEDAEAWFPPDVESIRPQELGGDYRCAVLSAPAAGFVRYTFHFVNRPLFVVVLKSAKGESVHRFRVHDPRELRDMLVRSGLAIAAEYGLGRAHGTPELVPYALGSRLWSVQILKQE